MTEKKHERENVQADLQVQNSTPSDKYVRINQRTKGFLNIVQKSLHYPWALQQVVTSRGIFLPEDVGVVHRIRRSLYRQIHV